ncbi:MAG TPA: MFS transporter [Candidatus Nanoarchaeia archaeon]|nr:enterobactin exporter EntS [uncultured archaeon]
MAKKVDVLLDEEELEIIAATTGRAPVQLPGRVASVFPALTHRNYQFYFAGQITSLMGFWLQLVGQGFLVFQLTHSAFWVGTVAALGGLPTLFLTSWAGVLIDKVDTRKLLSWILIVQALLALILGLTVLLGVATVELIIILAVLTGIAGAIDLPTRQTFVVELVGKKDLASAISVNVGIFNSARFVGPALAGILIATVGVGWTFIFNALSFLPIIFFLTKIKPLKFEELEANLHPFTMLKQGIKFVFTHERLLWLTLLASATGLFNWPHQTLMPVVAEKIYGAGASGLGSLLSAAGAGSLLGALFTSTQRSRKERSGLIIAGALISSLSLMLFGFNHNFFLAHLLLFFAGLGLIIQVANINTTVQTLAPDQMRGRVMGVYLTMFVGLMPIGNALAGILAERTSSLFTISLGGFILFIFSSFLYWRGYIK